MASHAVALAPLAVAQPTANLHHQVCSSLGVELEVVPMTEAYWQRVVSHSVAEIRWISWWNLDLDFIQTAQRVLLRETLSISHGLLH